MCGRHELPIMMGASKVFGLLASDRRRRVLLLLCEEESAEVPEAVSCRGDAAAPRTAGGDERARSRSRRLRRLRLYHADLPKLAAAGLIDWERGSDRVSRGPRFEEVEPLLDALASSASEVPQEIF